MVARSLMILALVAAGCSGPQTKVADKDSSKKQAAKAQKANPTIPATLAIAPLTMAQADNTWVGETVAAQVQGQLYAQKNINFYTTRQLEAAMRQARTQQADLNKGPSQQAVGKHLGATLLMVGQASVEGDKVTGQAQVVHVLSGKVEKTIELDGTLAQLPQLGAQLAAEIAVLAGGAKEPAKPKQAPDMEVVKSSAQVFSMLRKQSLSPRAANPLVEIGVSKEQLKEARALAEAACAKAPGYGPAQTALGLVEAMSGDSAKSLAALEKASDCPLTLLVKNFAYMRAGRFDDAEKLLRQAIAMHPGFLHARGSLAEILLHFGRFREARSAFAKYLKGVPNQPWVLQKIAYTDAKLGRHDQAVKEAKQATTLIPSSTYLGTELASRQIDAGDLAGAQKTLEKILKLAPDNATAQVRLGYVHLLQKNDEAAITASTKAVEMASGPRHRRDKAYAHLNLARAYGHTGKLDQSLEHLALARKAADVSLDEFESDPDLKTVRQDPRYLKLCK